MRYDGLVKTAVGLLVCAACVEPALDTETQGITTDVRHERFGLIRDSAAQMGMHNAALLAGIAISETNLAHCQAEATFACKGPPSPSCGGGPIIAGAADGPCDQMLGGLGMFQFDAGTYAQTLAAYGDSILTIEGNTAQAVNFVEVRVLMDIAGATDWMTAMAWLDSIPMDAADPLMKQWAAFIVCRYNGCCTTSSTCTTRANGYRDNAITAYGEMGADFWRTADRCTKLPDDGVIDQRSDCYLAAGDPRYWRVEASGYANNLEWTGTTSSMAPANFARWILKGSGMVHLDVHLDGGQFGQSKQAKYEIHHAGIVDVVAVDQSAANGWFALGDFELTGAGDEYVMLGDNTGEPSTGDTKLLFDAIRAQALDQDGGGCCDATRDARGSILLALLVVLRVRSRSRPRSRSRVPG